jgi:hypothetical protein
LIFRDFDEIYRFKHEEYIAIIFRFLIEYIDVFIREDFREDVEYFEYILI